LASALIGLAVVWLVVVVSPGPCFLTVVQEATRGSRRNGAFCALGIACGTAVWCLGSSLGLALVLATWSWLAVGIRIAGAAYLAWLGVKALRSSLKPMRDPEGALERPLVGARNQPEQVARSHWAALRRGLVVDLSNPKAAAFFTSLFAAFLPHGAPPSSWVLPITEVIAIEFLWYLVVVLLFSLAPVAAAYRRGRRVIDFVVGSVYLGLSGKLALSR
jgi:threonine/homoserine/homoserine lactone efflux protein